MHSPEFSWDNVASTAHNSGGDLGWQMAHVNKYILEHVHSTYPQCFCDDCSGTYYGKKYPTALIWSAVHKYMCLRKDGPV